MSHEPVTIRLASPLVARFAAETTVELKAAEGEAKRPSFSMVAYTVLRSWWAAFTPRSCST